MNKKGSEGILNDHSKEKMLRQVIVEFDEKHNLKAKVSYKDIYEYTKNCYSEKKIEFYPSYTWWKTKGKHLVDEFNMVKKKTIKINEKEELDIFEVVEIVEKHYGNKKELLKYLLPYNDIVDRMVNRIKQLEEMVQKLSKKIGENDTSILYYKKTIKKQERLIDGLFYIHISSKDELKQILQKGEFPSPVLNSAFNETFESPKKYLNEVSELIKISEQANTVKNSNVVKLQRKNEHYLDENDYDY